MSELKDGLVRLLRDFFLFVQHGSGLRLRRYQEQAALAIVDSVINHQGLSFVVIFPRQSGKNELQAQIETYLLAVYSKAMGEMVKVSPTWKPQSLNAMRRLERVLRRNVVTHDLWTKESGYVYRVGSARIFFLAGSPTTNVVGATANVLLECDEAQDILPSKWDKDFSPMAASTHATRVFWGTMWTSRTLLARELRAARDLEKVDGIRRVFLSNAAEVGGEVPAYGSFVLEQVQRLGRNHPLVRSQYFSEEIDAEGGMFPERRLELMRGEQGRIQNTGVRSQNGIYAMLIDVAGEDENAGDWHFMNSNQLGNPQRDSTALTVVEVDLSTLSDPLIRAPVYRVVDRVSWTGVKHPTIYAQIRALAERWQAKHLVIDATGVGAGLASFLDRALGRAEHGSCKVIPFLFNGATKSKLGWGFLAVVETGRYREPRVESGELGEIGLDNSLFATLQSQFFQQCRACQMEIIEGPEKRIKWGVPDGSRDPETGELVHDDWIMSAALCAVLDELEWTVSGAPVIVRGRDPLGEMDSEGF